MHTFFMTNNRSTASFGLRALSCVLLASVAMPAFAQDAAPQAGDNGEIVVTGFRKSLADAQQIKRDSVNVVESIVAEDIAKMPDLNIAESIQRIPGVAMSREGGEGRNITLRGFAPDFTRTTLNGMEVPASSDGLDSGGFTLNAGRTFDFHIFASELFNRIDVQKSQRASIEEGGIAGTVDLYTAHPFDYEGLTIVGSAQGGYNSITRKIDPRLSVLISNTFADDTVGVLFSASYSKRTVRQEGYGSVRWTSPFVNRDSWADTNPTVTGTPENCGAVDRLDCLWAPRLPRADYFGNDQTRLGLAGSIQVRPVAGMEISLDVLHSELENDRLSYNSMEWLLTHGAPGNYTGQTPVSFVVAPDGQQLIAASFNDVTSWYESREQTSISKFDQIVLSGKYEISPTVTLDAMVGTAQDKADRYELRFYSRSNPHAYSYDYRDNPYVPEIDYGNWDPNNPANFINGITGAHRTNDVKKKNFTAKSNLTFKNDDVSVQAGVAYNNRSVRFAEAAGQNVTFNPSSYMVAFPQSGLGRGLSGAGLIPFAVIDFDKIRSGNVVSDVYTNNVGAGWKVTEETLAAYIELNASFDIGSMVLRANTGLRYVRTNVTSEAVLAGTPVAAENDYDNYLPSLNLALDVNDNIVVRFAYARSMTRPGLSSLNIAGPRFGYTTRTVGNIGNPFLKPYQSNDIDLSLEYYTPNGGLIAIGLFNKDIVTSLKTDVITQMVDPSFWPAIYADPQYDASFNADPALVPYTFTIPVNSDNGNRVRGFEITVNQPFTFLPGALSNLGIAANYTHVSAQDSTGLSPNSYNLTGYYDDETFGFRVSMNKRDDYLLSQPGGNGHAQERKYGPTHIDLSAYYNVNESFTISVEGINITDEVERIYGTGYGDQNLTREYSHTGAQWFVGGRYKFK